jgi:hypothetical protein
MSFASVPALRAWLAKTHVRSEGIFRHRHRGLRRSA